jgi:preprotein translocase subunit SecG
VTVVLDFVQIVLCAGLIFLILMHSGKDSGLSGAFGVGTGSGPVGGGSLVERNLNRWTVAFAILFGQHRRPDQDFLTRLG